MCRLQICHYALNVSPADLAFEEVGVEEFGNCFEWLPELFHCLVVSFLFTP